MTALALLNSCQPKPPTESAGEQNIEQWEYAEHKAPGVFPKEEMNKLGVEGWELVSVIELRGPDRPNFIRCIFKRRLR
jgi:hypothetical protein